MTDQRDPDLVEAEIVLEDNSDEENVGIVLITGPGGNSHIKMTGD